MEFFSPLTKVVVNKLYNFSGAAVSLNFSALNNDFDTSGQTLITQRSTGIKDHNAYISKTFCLSCSSSCLPLVTTMLPLIKNNFFAAFC